MASTSASSFTSGWYENSQPAASSPSRPDCSNLSAINTRIVFNAPSDRVNQNRVAELRLEPGRLRRHDAARVGDANEVFYRGRIEREGDGRAALVDEPFEFLRPAYAA